MPVLVQLVHGYPPHEIAGTELYARAVTRGMQRRGWTVHVISATRSPGRPHGSVIDGELPGGGRLVRVVNNLPWRPLAQAEADPLIEGPVHEALDRLRPDLVHVQHLLFLSARLRIEAPVVLTLHDAWAWCARGGTLLRGGRGPCEGPSPEACAPCYEDWGRGSAVEHQLGRAAGALSRVVSPEHLHAAWRRVPERIKAPLRSGAGPTSKPADVEVRQAAVRAAYLRSRIRISPSQWLADQATRRGLGPVRVLRHGVAPGPPREGTGPILFLGTLVHHKGPHLVAEAWAMLEGAPPLELRGPPVDTAYVRTLPGALVHPALAPEAVPRALAKARMLVMGSVWPENAPLVVIEARASGCPIVAPRIGGLPELIEEGVDGALYEPGDPVALRRAMSAVLSRAWPDVRPPPHMEMQLDRLEDMYKEALAG